MSTGDTMDSQIPTEKLAARQYLESLLNKNLRIHTTDTRMFRGEFKCTDPDCNIVLSHAYEYRPPSKQKVAEKAESDTSTAVATGSLVVDMSSRYLGPVVIPGEHIIKIEVEEFASQLRKPT